MARSAKSGAVGPAADGTPAPHVRARANAHRRSPKVGHRSAPERAAIGKAARQRMPLGSHAEFVTAGRSDPIELLTSQALTRVPELVPIRYGRMVASPFSFYRGGALIMATDLGRTANSGLDVQLCGDAHMSNFGIYASPERRLVFDVNDFDETHPGPFEWDVKRLAASLAVAGRDNGFSAKKRRQVVLAAATAYRTSMIEFAGQGNLQVWYSHLDIRDMMAQIGDQVDAKRKRRTEAAADKAQSRDSIQALAKLTKTVDGRARILSQPPLLVPLEELLGQQRQSWPTRCWGVCMRPTVGRCNGTGVTCLSSTSWSRSHARSSAWAASAPGRGSCSSKDWTEATPCSCRPRRPRPRCCPDSSRPARRRTRANG